MHFLDHYALSCNLKVDKPSIVDFYYPLLQDKFITIDTSFDHPHFKYNHWQKVINILSIVLQSKDIQIIQLGLSSDPNLEGVVRTNGYTSFGQISYILKKSLLNISSNSLSSHIASAIDIESINLVRDKKTVHFKPNWSNKAVSFYGDKDDVFHRRNIDLINPEDIAKEACEKLGFDLSFDFKTIFIGEKYVDGIEFVETVPDQSVQLASLGTSSIIFRMDSFFNEQNLIHQLSQGKCTIVTNKRINFEIINKFKHNISELVYKIEENNDDVEFCDNVTKNGVNLILISNLNNKKIEPKKLVYMDFGLIMQQPAHRETKKNIKKYSNLKKCHYLSNKYTLSSGKVFSSESAWKKSIPSDGKFNLRPVIDDQLFWENLDTFWILEHDK